MTSAHADEAARAAASLDDAQFDPFVVASGMTLAEHEVYIDLANLGSGPFRALEGQTAGSGNRYIAERDIDPETWDLLVRREAEASMAIASDLENAED